jgi:MFS family permease
LRGASAAKGLSPAVVTLLAAAILINYVDRGNLATVGSLVQHELGLTHFQLGLLFSAFFFSYAPMQLVVGWMAERYSVARLLGCGLVAWSVATLAMGFAAGFLGLLALRLLLGVGESVFYPCSSKLLAAGAGNNERGKANGLIGAGQALGPTIGTFVGGMLAVRLGWRGLMIAAGVASLVWVVPWVMATRRLPLSCDGGGSLKPPSYLCLLRRRALWGASLGNFANNYTLYFVLSWLPSYLVNSQGLSLARMSTVGAFVYATYAVTAVGVGWLVDRLLTAGHAPNCVYKAIMVTSNVGLAVCMLLVATSPPALAVDWLIAAGVCFGLGMPMLFAIAQTLAGPRAAGQWAGLQNFAGNLSGFVAPSLTGWIVDRTGSYFVAFLVAGGISMIGALAWGVAVPRVETLSWPGPGAEGAAVAGS